MSFFALQSGLECKRHHSIKKRQPFYSVLVWLDWAVFKDVTIRLLFSFGPSQRSVDTLCSKLLWCNAWLACQLFSRAHQSHPHNNAHCYGVFCKQIFKRWHLQKLFGADVVEGTVLVDAMRHWYRPRQEEEVVVGHHRFRLDLERDGAQRDELPFLRQSESKTNNNLAQLSTTD